MPSWGFVKWTKAWSCGRNPDVVWNIPNRITVARLVLSVVVFFALYREAYAWAFFLFLITVGTDWLDGFLARRWNQITQFGRIVDPVADKVVICGTFVFLAAVAESPIRPWMAVVVLVRELAITVIRGFLEQHGKDFSARWSGKLKMVLQSAAAAACMWLLHRYAAGIAVGRRLPLLANGLAWLSVATTIYSGVIYWPAAQRLFQGLSSDGAESE